MNFTRFYMGVLLPSVAFFGKLTGTLSSDECFNLIQTDLLADNLEANNEILSVTNQNSRMLQKNSYFMEIINNQLTEANHQLYEINYKLSGISQLLESQINNEQYRNEALENIYKIKKITDDLETKSDKIAIAIRAYTLLQIIYNNNITTSTFNTISDKQYFDSVVESLETKISSLSDEGQKEIEGFIKVYSYTQELITKLEDARNIKVINLPENISEIPECFNEDTLEEKINKIKYSSNKSLLESINYEKIYSELIGKYRICETVINKYLNEHPDLLEEYSLLNYIEKETEIVDYNYVIERCNLFIKYEKEKYEKELIENQLENKNYRNYKKRNGLKKILKTILFIILGIAILVIIYLHAVKKIF